MQGGQRCSLKEIENGLKGLIAGTIMPTNLDPDITLGSLITRTIRKKKKVPPTEPDSNIVPAGLALGAMYVMSYHANAFFFFKYISLLFAMLFFKQVAGT